MPARRRRNPAGKQRKHYQNLSHQEVPNGCDNTNVIYQLMAIPMISTSRQPVRKNEKKEREKPRSKQTRDLYQDHFVIGTWIAPRFAKFVKTTRTYCI